MAKLPALRMPTATTPALRRRAINYYEWCQDHNKPLQAAPFGDVAGGGPVTLPDPNIFTNGAWYGGSPYLGPMRPRAVGVPTGVDSALGHDRELARRGRLCVYVALAQRARDHHQQYFPGGMLMMMLVPWVSAINEAK
jgi:hypothetical protein